MTKQEFLRELEEVLEVDVDSIKGDETLVDLGSWDSLAVMTFIAMVDEKFGVTLAASKLADAKSVVDLIALLGNKISDM
jgi:acyl carrier protein